MLKLIRQSYDEVTAMNGKHCGVQTIIKKVAPNTHYKHCRSHSNNLVIVKSLQSTKFSRNFFGILEQLFVVIEELAKRHE